MDAAATSYDSQVTYVQIQSSCGGFTPAPTPPAPSPTPPTPPTTSYARYGDCATGGQDILAEVSGPFGSTFPNVLKISGICYEYIDLGGSTGPVYTNYTGYTDCATCQAAPTPTPPTPPTPTPTTCFAINNIARNTSSGNDACTAARRETQYFDNSSFCAATVYYGTSSTCSSLGIAGYISNGSYSRYWNGTAFTTSCVGCP